MEEMPSALLKAWGKQGQMQQERQIPRLVAKGVEATSAVQPCPTVLKGFSYRLFTVLMLEHIKN